MGRLKSEAETASDREFDLAEHGPDFAYAKRFVFSKHDPLNRVIAEVDGPLSYKISTKSTVPLFGSDVTTITRIENGSEREVAQIKWKHYEADRSELQWKDGERGKLWEYLRDPTSMLEGAMERPRTFQVKGQDYTWQWSTDQPQPHFELVDDKDTQLARDVREKGGLFIPYTRSSGLLVNPEAVHLLDQIIVTHVAIAQREWMVNSTRRNPEAAAINMTLKA